MILISEFPHLHFRKYSPQTTRGRLRDTHVTEVRETIVFSSGFLNSFRERNIVNLSPLRNITQRLLLCAMIMITPAHLHLHILLKMSAIINLIEEKTAVCSRKQVKDLDLFEQI